MTKSCDYCGAKETNNLQLHKCTGCNSKKKLYCSRECQKLAWKIHRGRCRRTSHQLDTLILDNEKLPSFDKILTYASKHFRSLRHVKLVINDAEEKGLTRHGKPISRDALQLFLQSHRNLQLFVWHVNDFCVQCSKEMTNDGKVWMELNGLQILQMKFPVFGNCQDLVKTLKKQEDSIVSLTLSNLILGKAFAWTFLAWTRNDSASLANSISQCKQLVRLNLRPSDLRDSDVEMIVSGLPKLRLLFVSGPFDGKGGHLTDKACKSISRHCTNLQQLNIGSQRKITLAGVKRVFKSCPHLRMFHTSANIKPNEAKSLVSMAPPTLLFIGLETRFDEITYRDLIVAVGGRVVFYTLGEDAPYNIDKMSKPLSEAVRDEYVFTHDILRKMMTLEDNPKVINEWECFFMKDHHNVDVV